MGDKEQKNTTGLKLNGFDLQMFAYNLPVNPDTAQGTVGSDYILYVNTGTVTTPIWTKVVGQRSSPLNQTADTIDVSHKGTGKYKATLAGLKAWNISLDALAMLNDVGSNVLEYAYKQSLQVNIKLERPDLYYVTGWASITEFSLETPYEGAATISSTLEGAGPLTDWTEPIE